MKSSTPIRDLTAAARAGLAGNWGKSIGVTLVYGILVVCISIVPVIGEVLSWVLSAPLIVGVTIYFLATLRGRDNRFSQLFEGFNCFGTAFCAYLLVVLLILAWTLPLGVLVGVAAALLNSPLILAVLILILIAVMIPLQMRYSLALYVVADDPSVRARQAIGRGIELMKGNYWRLGLFWLRFVGWQLLAVLTLGIGFIWLAPYYMAAMTAFYDDLARNG